MTRRTPRQYPFERLLIVATLLLSVSGFWSIYAGADAAPTAHHHLHLGTTFAWLFLLLHQLRLVEHRRYGDHRRVGLAVLVLGPLVFATTAMLSVHSAHRALVSGQGDFLIVQNVMVTLELGALILLAFVLRRRRKLHGALMTSTAILCMGIALFFTLISFVPPFRIEGPETFHRFQTAGMTGQGIVLVVGLLLFAKDRRNGWPFLLVAASFPLNELIRASLESNAQIEPVTAFVGSMGQAATFVVCIAALLAALMATGGGGEGEGEDGAELRAAAASTAGRLRSVHAHGVPPAAGAAPPTRFSVRRAAWRADLSSPHGGRSRPRRHAARRQRPSSWRSQSAYRDAADHAHDRVRGRLFGVAHEADDRVGAPRLQLHEQARGAPPAGRRVEHGRPVLQQRADVVAGLVRRERLLQRDAGLQLGEHQLVVDESVVLEGERGRACGERIRVRERVVGADDHDLGRLGTCRGTCQQEEHGRQQRSHGRAGWDGEAERRVRRGAQCTGRWRIGPDSPGPAP